MNMEVSGSVDITRSAIVIMLCLKLVIFFMTVSGKHDPKPRIHSHGRVRWIISSENFQYINYDGQLYNFCGCTDLPDLPRPAEEITEWVRSWDIPEGQKIMDEWHFENLKEMVRKSRAGEPVCNPNGTPLWEKPGDQ